MVDTYVKFGICGTCDPRLEPAAAERAGNLTKMVASKIHGKVLMPGKYPATVVYTDVLIDGVKAADLVALQFKEAQVDVIIFVCDTWDFPGATVEALLAHFPKDMVFFFVCGNSGPKPGVVFTHASNGMEAQFGKMSQMVIGSWPDEGQDVEMTDETTQQVVDLCQAAVAKVGVKGKRLVLFGHESMWMRTGMPHILATLEHFGIQLLQYDMKLLVDLFTRHAYDDVDLKLLEAWIDDGLGDRRASKGDEVANQRYRDGLAYYLILSKFLEDHNAIGGSFMSQLEWASTPQCVPLPVLDTAESLFNSTHDFRSAKVPKSFATETDVQALLTMVFNSYLSGGEPGLFMDYRKVWEKSELMALCRQIGYELTPQDEVWLEGFWDGDNSGSASFDWAGTPDEPFAEKMARIRTFLADPNYFHGGGDSINFLTPPGIGCIVNRLAYHHPSNSFAMLWDEATTVMPPALVAEEIAKKTTYEWPHTFIKNRSANMLQAKNYTPANHQHASWGIRSRVMRYFLHLTGIKDVHASLWPAIDGEHPPVPLVKLIAPDGWKHEV